MRAVSVVRKEKIDFLLAVGGGSVLDGTKFGGGRRAVQGRRAVGHPGEGGPGRNAPSRFGCVLTLPATGSESNGSAVISRSDTEEKLHFTSPHVYPQFAILDPLTNLPRSRNVRFAKRQSSMRSPMSWSSTRRAA